MLSWNSVTAKQQKRQDSCCSCRWYDDVKEFHKKLLSPNKQQQAYECYRAVYNQ